MGMVLEQRTMGVVSSARPAAVAFGGRSALLVLRSEGPLTALRSSGPSLRSTRLRRVAGADYAIALGGGEPVTLLETDAQSFRVRYQWQLASTGSNDPDNSPPLLRALDSTIA